MTLLALVMGELIFRLHLRDFAVVSLPALAVEFILKLVDLFRHGLSLFPCAALKLMAPYRPSVIRDVQLPVRKIVHLPS